MLNDVQKSAVSQWIADGAGLSEVQKRIKEEFGLSMTYMDVRFLALDLKASVKDKPEPKNDVSSKDAPQTTPANVSDDGEKFSESDEKAIEDENDVNSEEDKQSSIGGNVSVTLDRIVRAGAIASGDVTFSDGVTGSWLVDRMGRLSLTKISKDGYQPTNEDIQAFQMELQAKLSNGAY